MYLSDWIFHFQRRNKSLCTATTNFANKLSGEDIQLCTLGPNHPLTVDPYVSIYTSASMRVCLWLSLALPPTLPFSYCCPTGLGGRWALCVCLPLPLQEAGCGGGLGEQRPVSLSPGSPLRAKHDFIQRGGELPGDCIIRSPRATPQSNREESPGPTHPSLALL
ncbi:homeobox protein Hox-D3 [Platysternon megacephalum]|uniref:Homeobox protein Hox-D3 n=1 Tax=Platysternon megacephalum TaxID=55544 RepID=A0A4D9F5L5_9SAUR|nr:homeobox protein Hox-D3 [Platysternon megacephalum]